MYIFKIHGIGRDNKIVYK